MHLREWKRTGKIHANRGEGKGGIKGEDQTACILLAYNRTSVRENNMARTI